MRTVRIVERTVAISRFADPHLPSGGLTTSVVALVTDVRRHGRTVIGYGFASFGRYAQGGLIRDRFAPRLLAADCGSNLDPFKAWHVMLTGEKPGGHGERCVAIGTLDMALWDAAAKIADMPVWQLQGTRLAKRSSGRARVPVYAGGGYYYPERDVGHLREELGCMLNAGFTRAKIKIADATLSEDLERIQAAAEVLGSPSAVARRDPVSIPSVPPRGTDAGLRRAFRAPSG